MEAECQGYAFNKIDEFCSLKSTVAFSRLDPRFLSGLKSGIPHPKLIESKEMIESVGNKAFSNRAFLIVVNTQFDHCKARCLIETNCMALTFRRDSGDCHLFDFVSGISDVPDADSAIKHQRSP
jgi:hypothetical protein